jgi:crotonobetainyl-CoA:carnitine CoA-transferase CaiB-like acyl-CoA transferase
VPDLLRGVHVLDLTRLLPGPFCTRLLADLGAQVVKLEDRRLGDYARSIAGAVFAAMNHGKRSMAVDLRHPQGKAVFFRILPRFDVLVEGFRPGVMARLGCGYEDARRAHPGLIYCAISGYGAADPALAARSGHDINYMARAGLLSGAAGPLTVPAADFAGGYAAALQIAAALHARHRTGAGCFLDISMTAAVLPMGYTRATRRLQGGLACYHLYRTADGRQFSLGALEPKFFAAFAAAVGRPELVERQYGPAQEELKAELDRIFATRTRDEWDAFFAGIDACGGPVLAPAEALPGDPPSGPSHGEHTREVLAESGLQTAEIDTLFAAGAVGSP